MTSNQQAMSGNIKRPNPKNYYFIHFSRARHQIFSIYPPYMVHKIRTSFRFNTQMLEFNIFIKCYKAHRCECERSENEEEMMIIIIMFGILSENGPNDANNAEQIGVVWMKKRENRKFVLNKSRKATCSTLHQQQ